MSLSLSQSPYFDDYNPNKQFYEILFRPGVGVQARELTELQDIIKNQFLNFGNNIFQDGAMVIPGNITFNQLPFVLINATYSSSAVNYSLLDPNSTVNNGKQVTISGITSGVTALVVGVDSTNNILYIQYTNSGSNNNTGTFTNGEVLNLLPANTGVAQAISAPSTGVSSSASIADGVYYVGGQFVNVYSQTVVVSASNPTPSARIGLQIQENFVTPEEDASLTDTATGTPNYAAPGAHRYKINLALTVLPVTVTNSPIPGFIELIRVVNGVIQKLVNNTVYSILGQTLARRTFDTNGNFIVRQFKLDMHENLLVGNNGGILTSGQGGDITKLSCGIEPGKAYVEGFEIQTISTVYKTLDKAQTTGFFQNSEIQASLGNFVYLNRLFSLPNYNSCPQINLYNTPITTDGVAPGSPIGTATIRGLQFSQGAFSAIGSPGPIFEGFLTDIRITSSGLTMNDVRSFSVNDGTITSTGNILSQLNIINVTGSFAPGSTITSGSLTETVYAWDTTNNLLLTLPATLAIATSAPITSSATGTATIQSRTVLFNPSEVCLVYPLPQPVVSTVRDQGGNVTTNYTYRKVFAPVATSGGTVTFSTGAYEVFNSVDVIDYVASIETGSNAGQLINVVAASPSLSSGLTQITFTAPSGTTIKLSATVEKEISQEKTKTLQNQNLHIASSVPNVINLGRADIFALLGVYEGTDTTGLDITSNYTLNNGQMDGLYNFGTLTLNPGMPVPSQVYIQFQYFSHGAGDYFSVNSYTNFGSFSNWYSLIPTYNSPTAGFLFLRDSLDFRPRVDDSTWPPASTVPAVPTYAITGNLVTPNTNVQSDFSYYLPRVDKLYIDPRGNFQITKGNPSLSPLEPPDPVTGMVIAVLYYGAYTFGPSNVLVTMVPNKGYTMADIAKLETRIANLEYYTSLNLLEQNTANFSVQDATTGLDRLQSGFVVDNFVDNNISDYTNPDIEFSIDAPNNTMRPPYNSDSVQMVYSAPQSSNIEYQTKKPNNTLLSLPYSEIPVVSQLSASRIENINPYNVFNYVGQMTLTPASDTWMATNYLPDILATNNTLYNSILAQDTQNNVLGTIWNAWTTDWVGTPTLSTSNYSTSPPLQYTNNAEGEIIIAPGQNVPVTSSSITTQTQQVGQTRTGVTTTLANVPQEKVDSVVVNVGMVPYIRENSVAFSVGALKPLTQHYAFFDAANVNAFVTPSPLISDANGHISGTFNIPDPSVSGNPAFRTGARVFSLVNDPNNNSNLITSFAKATYTASGTLETDQNTITSTGVPVIQTTNVTQTQVISQSTVVSSSSETSNDDFSYSQDPSMTTGTYVDPLAQSFLINSFAGGECLTSLDLYFQSKDSTVPVIVQIREMSNGSPTQTILPYSSVILLPSQINISADASAITNVPFQSPVYLQPSKEYCIVLMSNSNNFNVWCAEMGDFYLNTDNYISKVPYSGLLFKSQNASTWIPSPTEALMFTLYRAQFNIGVTGIAFAANQSLPSKNLPALSMITYSGTNIIRILHPNHNMSPGSLVNLSIVPGVSNVNWSASYNGIAASSIIPVNSGAFRASSQPSGVADTVVGTRAYFVNNVEVDSYTIAIVDGSNNPLNSSSSGLTGTPLVVTQNRSFDVLMPISEELNFAGTGTSYFFKGYTQQSVDGSQIPYNLAVNNLSFPYLQFIPNQNSILPAPCLIASQINEDNLIRLGSPGSFLNKSHVWQIQLQSDADNLSPLVDTTRLSAIAVSNRIDFRINDTNPTSSPVGVEAAYVAETASSGATSMCGRYITRPATLQNSADSLHVLINVLWPATAEVDLYYKILPVNTNATFASQPYILMTPDPNTNFSPAQSPSDNRDYYWTADNVGEFVTFAIKVVARSVNSSAVPLFKQFRCIALEQ